MGGLLGFHPPQFSEEVAWLPAWLQPSTIGEASNEAFQCPSVRGLEEMQCLQQNIYTTEYGSLSDDGRSKRFRLFLSGEDNSPMHFPSCSSNHEVQYHLHLSMNEETENSLNPFLNKSQAERFEVNQALPEKQLDANVIHEEDACEVDYNADKVYAVPSRQRECSEISGHESLILKEEKGTKPKVDTRSPKVNAKDAAELAVAASEALIIHEVVKDEPSTELWTASAVLEAALQVKQARLEDSKETLSSSIEESSEIDFLSDLDESTMADAYEDVGFTVTGHGDLHGYESAISHVKDSYASENYMPNAKEKCNEPGGLEVDSGSISTAQQLKEVNNANILLKRGLGLESSEGGTLKEHVDDAAVGTENVDLACDIDHMFCSVQQANFLTREAGLQEGFTIGDVTSSQTISRSSLRPRSSGYDEKEDKVTNLVPDRFQSRWFGGWTWKNEANVSAFTDHKCAKSIPEPFVNETSSLSESADIAPDKNSCAQKLDRECKIVSQSSVAAEATYEKASNNRNVISEDVATSPTVSPMDPLCSVVPCSITSVAQNCTHLVNLEKHLSPIANANSDNLKRVSPQSTDFFHGEWRSVISGESSPTLRRQVTSLKKYSMLYPRYDSYLGKESTRGESLPLKCALNFPPVMQSPVTNLRDDNDNHSKVATGKMELPSCTEKEMNLPMTINCENASGCLDIGGEENPERIVVPQNNVELQMTKVCENVESNCENPVVPRRKRVRFSEAEISFPQVKKFQTLQTRDKGSSIATRLNKRLKSSHMQPQARPHEIEGRVTDSKMIFRNLSFLLTGFSVKKYKQIEVQIRKSGGIVLNDVPSPPTSRGKRCSRFKCQLLPLILCPRRLLTTKFLYGCAVNACILKVKWLFDSINKGSILPPKKYVVLKEHASQKCMVIGKPVFHTYSIFDNVAIMLHGKPNFCTKMAKVIKHGGGLVFKTLHWLIKSLNAEKVSVGAIVVEDENSISRQLKQCALEQKLPVMIVNWIINSLYAGRLLPWPEHRHTSTSLPSKLPDLPVSVEMSEEI